MPRKRKANTLGRSTAAAKRVRLNEAVVSSQETSEQRAQRLSDTAARVTAARLSETSDQNTRRRASDAAAHASARLSETDERTVESRA